MNEGRGRPLTIGEWMMVVAVCAVLLLMFTPTLRSSKGTDVLAIVAALSYLGMSLSPFFLLLRTPRRIGPGPDFEWKALATAGLLSLTLFLGLPAVFWVLTRLYRQWTAGGG